VDQVILLVKTRLLVICLLNICLGYTNYHTIRHFG